jgi:hypothetical protein
MTIAKRFVSHVQSELQSSFLGYRISCDRKIVTIFMEHGDCVNMSTAIEFALEVCPEVQDVETQSGLFRDTRYLLGGNGTWVAWSSPSERDQILSAVAEFGSSGMTVGQFRTRFYLGQNMDSRISAERVRDELVAAGKLEIVGGRYVVPSPPEGQPRRRPPTLADVRKFRRPERYTPATDEGNAKKGGGK